MLLKDNKVFKLPRLMGGSFSGLDRLDIPYNILILKDVTQREDNGNIELLCQAKDGPEQKSGGVRFSVDDSTKRIFYISGFSNKLVRILKLFITANSTLYLLSNESQNKRYNS